MEARCRVSIAFKEPGLCLRSQGRACGVWVSSGEQGLYLLGLAKHTRAL